MNVLGCADSENKWFEEEENKTKIKKDKIESILTFEEEKEMNEPIIKRTSDTTLRRGAVFNKKKFTFNKTRFNYSSFNW